MHAWIRTIYKQEMPNLLIFIGFFNDIHVFFVLFCLPTCPTFPPGPPEQQQINLAWLIICKGFIVCIIIILVYQVHVHVCTHAEKYNDIIVAVTGRKRTLAIGLYAALKFTVHVVSIIHKAKGTQKIWSDFNRDIIIINRISPLTVE